MLVILPSATAAGFLDRICVTDNLINVEHLARERVVLHRNVLSTFISLDDAANNLVPYVYENLVSVLHCYFCYRLYIDIINPPIGFASVDKHSHTLLPLCQLMPYFCIDAMRIGSFFGSVTTPAASMDTH